MVESEDNYRDEIMKELRFFVDHRVGCIAVRDRTLMDPDEQGCGPDKPDVVHFWMGVWVKSKLPLANNSTHEWSVPEEAVKAAHQACSRLNHAGHNQLGEL